MTMKVTKTEPLMQFIVSAGPTFGLGHLRRMQAVARACLDTKLTSNIRFFIMGYEKNTIPLSLFNLNFCEIKFGNVLDLSVHHSDFRNEVLVFDLHRQHLTKNLFDYLNASSEKGSFIVTIDHLATIESIRADIRWIPSFFKDPLWPPQLDIDYGWGNYLFEKKRQTAVPPRKNRLLILTGGSDIAGLSYIWPKLLDERLDQPIEITWVQGPFSQSPIVSQNSKHHFLVIKAPDGLDDLINSNDWVLSVHGISVFESLSYTRPTIVFNPYLDHNVLEMSALEEANVAFVAHNHDEIIAYLKFLMTTQEKAITQNSSITHLLDGHGAYRLVEKIKHLCSTLNLITT